MAIHGWALRLATAALPVASFLVASGAFAQGYPVKPVRLISPFAPGGGNDFMARLIAHKLTEGLRQQVIVENRAGAGGALGIEVGVKSPADGYTLTVIGGSYSVNSNTYRIGFDPVLDVTPIVKLAQGPYVLVAHPSLPARTTKELIALAKAKPGALNYASSGQGGLSHLATELLSMMAGIKLTHIPYKGTGPAVTDTIAGHTQLMLASPAAGVPHVRSGRLRGIGVTTLARFSALPDVPAVHESGLKGYEVYNWHGLIAPKGVARTIVDLLNAEANKALKAKDMEEKLAADGVSPAGGTPEQLAAAIKREVETWRSVAQKVGVKPE
jgi:tripartite-type tricarboxylate transporter receptor subunit TctC